MNRREFCGHSIRALLTAIPIFGFAAMRQKQSQNNSLLSSSTHLDSQQPAKIVEQSDSLTGSLSHPCANEDAAKVGTDWVWQIDPYQCVQCGRCETSCILTPSAVKCTHVYAICGYCKLCGAYYPSYVKELDTGAEHQLCPTKAIQRKFIEDPYFEYTIIEELCIGCGKCVKACSTFGNGSLFLQVRHDRCVGCNECAIARQCPSQAFRRVPRSAPYLVKGLHEKK